MGGVNRYALGISFALGLMGWVSPAEARVIMLFAPHGDDALLYGAGVIEQAVLNNDTAIVVSVTDSACPQPGLSDDINSHLGEIRVCEMLNALDYLARNPTHDTNVVGWYGQVVPIFLGYPDGKLEGVYNAPDNSPVGTNCNNTHSTTYATWKEWPEPPPSAYCNSISSCWSAVVGGPPCSCRYVQDWATRSGRSSSEKTYTGNHLRRDVKEVIGYYSPDAVYVPSVRETHPDHAFTSLVVQHAINEIAAEGDAVPQVYEAAVHVGSEGTLDGTWPVNSAPTDLVSSTNCYGTDYFIGAGTYPGDSGKFTAPPYSTYPYGTNHNDLWEMRRSFDVPLDMRWDASVDDAVKGSTKERALRMFCTEWVSPGTGGSWYFPRFVKQDEIFWSKEHNIARSAVASASTEYQWFSDYDPSNSAFTASRAIDGIIGVPSSALGACYAEWAAIGPTGWITLTWDRPHWVDRVVLYDRFNGDDNITEGTLAFSDGSTIAVSAASFSGSQSAVFNFAPKTITSVSFSISQSQGPNTGLAEFEVYEVTNIAPLSQASASSSYVYDNTPMGPDKAIDRVVDGSPVDWTKEWATNGEVAGAWIRTDWDHAYTIDRVVLHDRPNVNEQVTAGTLTFGDGSSLSSGALPNDGTGDVVSFPPKTVSWLRFTVDSGSGWNIGLSELEVHQARNIARDAVATASSAYLYGATYMSADKAIDGVVDGSPHDWTKEWASQGESNTAWISLHWATPRRINRVVLFDRPNLADNILGGYLKFSDNTRQDIRSVASTGTAITFDAKTTSDITLFITGALGPNIGLAEFEVYEAQ